MKSSLLKQKLKKTDGVPETLNIRLHRAISWLQCAEDQEGNLDLQFLSLWIAFNTCYALPINEQEKATERKKFQGFILKLAENDHERRIFNILWEKFSGPVKLLIDNPYVFRPFWDYHRGEVSDWEVAFEKSSNAAIKYLSDNNVAGLLEILLDRLYVLRNQLMHGGATYKSRVNRKQLKDGTRILQFLVPIIVDIMMQFPEEDWGEILYPVVG